MVGALDEVDAEATGPHGAQNDRHHNLELLHRLRGRAVQACRAEQADVVRLLLDAHELVDEPRSGRRADGAVFGWDDHEEARAQLREPALPLGAPQRGALDSGAIASLVFACERVAAAGLELVKPGVQRILLAFHSQIVAHSATYCKRTVADSCI